MQPGDVIYLVQPGNQHMRGEIVQVLESAQVLAQLDDGRRVTIERDQLQLQPDGSYATVFQQTDEPTPRPGMVLPVLEERLESDQLAPPPGPVRISRLANNRQVLVDEPLMKEDVEIQRVIINQFVDGPVDIHYDGGTVVIPLLEEVIVIEKRLVLREELRITRRQRHSHDPQYVDLWREDVTVEPADRTPGPKPGEDVDAGGTPP